MHEKEFAFADAAFAAGNLAASEVVCRDILDEAPRHADALNLLGIIAAKVKAVEQAQRYFAAAIEADSSNQAFQRNLELTKFTFVRKPDSTPRYLVIKAWGFGFWSDISHVLGSLLLAEITGRIPVIHLGKSSLYADDSGADVFGRYFQPVSDLGLTDVAAIAGATFFPAKWNKANLAQDDVAKWKGAGSRLGALNFLNRRETVAVSDFYVGAIYVQPWIPADHPMHGKALDEIHRYLLAKYLRLNKGCQAECDAFFDRHLQGAPFAAVHMRGADKILEDADVRARHEACMAELAAVDPSWRIFLLTDDAPMAERLKAQYGDRIVLTDAQRSSSIVGVHCDPAADRVKAAQEVVVDTFLGARADRFIGTGRSNISTLIAAMKDWLPGHCTIFGDNQIMERNLFIFTGSAD